MGVYEVVPRPEARKVISSNWVYRIKRGPDGLFINTGPASYIFQVEGLVEFGCPAL